MNPTEIVAEGEKLMKECFEAVGRILGRKSSNEEISLVNHLFDYAGKEIY